MGKTMKQSPQQKDSIKPLLDLASEEVLSWTDEEVRARAAEDGVDVEANAQAFRAALSKHAHESRLVRLRRARVTMESQAGYEAKSSTGGLTTEGLKTRLAEIIASGLMAKDSRLSLAFRDGKEIDEDDLRSLIEDYEELRARQERGDDSST